VLGLLSDIGFGFWMVRFGARDPCGFLSNSGCPVILGFSDSACVGEPSPGLLLQEVSFFRAAAVLLHYVGSVAGLRTPASSIQGCFPPPCCPKGHMLGRVPEDGY